MDAEQVNISGGLFYSAENLDVYNGDIYNIGSINVTLSSSLGDVPFLGPAKTAIEHVANIVQQVEDNKNQYTYLLKRSTDLCLQVKRLGAEFKGDAAQEFANPLSELNSTLDQIRQSVEQFSQYGRFDRLLKRQEISGSIEESHASLDRCMELFNLKAISTLASVALDIKAAREQDQAYLDRSLAQLLRNDANIIQILEVQHNESLEAVRQLRNIVPSETDDRIRSQLSRIETLLARQTNSPAEDLSSTWSVSYSELTIYRERVLGSGGFGTVYEGEWSGTRVAVKQVAVGTSSEVLTREINIWRQLHHPHIASFFRACLESNPPLLLSQLYPSGDVIKLLSGGRAHEINRVNLCHEISLGMVFLHCRKIVHGDLKPGNVLIDDAGCARITDFGLSKVKSFMTTRTSANIQQVQGTISGTRAFMSPERLRGKRLDFPVDVYAFAMTMYQILTDEAPFQFIPEADIQQAVVEREDRPERPHENEFVARGLTDSVWELIESSWAQQKSDRPAFTEIAARLRPLIACGQPGIVIPVLTTTIPTPRASLALPPPVPQTIPCSTSTTGITVEDTKYVITLARQIYTTKPVPTPEHFMRMGERCEFGATIHVEDRPLGSGFNEEKEKDFHGRRPDDFNQSSQGMQWVQYSSDSALRWPAQGDSTNIIVRKSSTIRIVIRWIHFPANYTDEDIFGHVDLSGKELISLATRMPRYPVKKEITLTGENKKNYSKSVSWMWFHARGSRRPTNTELDKLRRLVPDRGNPIPRTICVALYRIAGFPKRGMFSGSPDLQLGLRVDEELQFTVQNWSRDPENPRFHPPICDKSVPIVVYNSSTVVVEAHDKKKPAGSIEEYCGAVRFTGEEVITLANKHLEDKIEFKRLGSKWGMLEYQFWFAR